MGRIRSDRMPPPLEKDIRETIRQVAHACGIALFNTEANAYKAASGGMRRSGPSLPVGYPDLGGWIVGTGKAVLVEVKRPGKYPTEAQHEFLVRANLDGVIAIWMDDAAAALPTFQRIRDGWTSSLGEWTHLRDNCLLVAPGACELFHVAPWGRRSC
jgi:hypothetical protein